MLHATPRTTLAPNPTQQRPSAFSFRSCSSNFPLSCWNCRSISFHVPAIEKFRHTDAPVLAVAWEDPMELRESGRSRKPRSIAAGAPNLATCLSVWYAGQHIENSTDLYRAWWWSEPLIPVSHHSVSPPPVPSLVAFPRQATLGLQPAPLAWPRETTLQAAPGTGLSAIDPLILILSLARGGIPHLKTHPYVLRSIDAHRKFYEIYIDIYIYIEFVCVCACVGVGEIKLNQFQSQYHWEYSKGIDRYESLRISAGNKIMSPNKMQKKCSSKRIVNCFLSLWRGVFIFWSSMKNRYGYIIGLIQLILPLEGCFYLLIINEK